MKTLVCFGDSNTHGTPPMRKDDEKNRLEYEQRWPGVVANFLGSDWRVIEEGLPGRTTVHDDPIEGRHKNGLSALPMVLESHRPIDMLVIMLGTNDLKTRFSVTAADIACSAGKLVETAAGWPCWSDDTNPRVLLVCPAPIAEVGTLRDMFAGGLEKSNLLALQFAEIAGRLNCEFLDAGTIVTSSSIDGVHLDETAHQALGTAIGQKIRTLNQE